jgi:hypothetical protein
MGGTSEEAMKQVTIYVRRSYKINPGSSSFRPDSPPPRLPSLWGELLASLILAGAIMGGAYWGLRIQRPPYMWLPYRSLPTDVLLETVGGSIGLGIAAAGMRFVRRSDIRAFVVFAICSVGLSFPSFVLVGALVGPWVNITLDRSPARRVKAVMRGSVFEVPMGTKYNRVIDYAPVFTGLKVEPIDAPLTFIARSVLPEVEELPAKGAIITMTLHPGRLGFPWVDDVAWPRPDDLP